MSPLRAKLLLPVIQAFAEGKVIQHRPSNTGAAWWDSCGHHIEFRDDHDYRIKPEPKWRAWLPSEVPKYFMAKNFDVMFVGYRCSPGCSSTHPANMFAVPPDVKAQFPDTKELVEVWTWVREDGTETPCGVLENPE